MPGAGVVSLLGNQTLRNACLSAFATRLEGAAESSKECVKALANRIPVRRIQQRTGASCVSRGATRSHSAVSFQSSGADVGMLKHQHAWAQTCRKIHAPGSTTIVWFCFGGLSQRFPFRGISLPLPAVCMLSQPSSDTAYT